jgi:alginate O-acetyltransferase complex protein AlgI
LAGATAAGSTDFAAAPSGSARVSPTAAQQRNAKPDLGRFLVLCVELCLLALVVSLFNLEGAGFGRLVGGVFCIFAVHYWVPFRFKEALWVLASIGGAFYILQPLIASLVIAAGVALFLILRAPIALRWRLIAVGAIFVVLGYGRITERLPIPSEFYAMFGAIFMFRMILYAYDLAHSKEPAQPLPFFSYFLLLPNFYFTLFPTIDYKTMRRSYYQRDIHDIAQQGIHWMMRGAIQLVLYRLVVYFKDPYLPDRVDTLPKLIVTMILTYLTYLNVSGQFHFIVGLLHLFGYDLPETNHKYLLARSFTDFWRRINIYWKDFMVKVIYFPIFFKFRKTGEKRAQIIATIGVFVATWAFHWWQSFWLLGQTAFNLMDAIFYTILGLLVLAEVLWGSGPKKPKQAPSLQTRALHASQVFGTFTTIAILWTFWSSPSISAWSYLMTHWARSH